MRCTLTALLVFSVTSLASAQELLANAGTASIRHTDWIPGDTVLRDRNLAGSSATQIAQSGSAPPVIRMAVPQVPLPPPPKPRPALKNTEILRSYGTTGPERAAVITTLQECAVDIDAIRNGDMARLTSPSYNGNNLKPAERTRHRAICLGFLYGHIGEMALLLDVMPPARK